MASPRQWFSFITSVIYNHYLSVASLLPWLSPASVHLSHLLGIPADTVLLELRKHHPNRRMFVLSTCQKLKVAESPRQASCCCPPVQVANLVHVTADRENMVQIKEWGQELLLGLDGNHQVRGSSSSWCSSTGEATDILCSIFGGVKCVDNW